MTTQNSRSSGGRRSGRGRRGGGRQRGGYDREREERGPRDERSPRGPGDYRPGGGSRQPAPEPKLTFWQKLLSLIGLGPKKKPDLAPAARLPRSTPSVTSKYPSRSEGGERSAAPAASAPAPYTRPARKPEAVEVTTEKLYVGNLSFDATESDLQELFSGAGAVRAAEIVAHKQTEKSKGFGFVTMATVEEAKRAVAELHDKEFMGRKLVVSGAKTPVDRSV